MLPLPHLKGEETEAPDVKTLLVQDRGCQRPVIVT